jgi:DNA-binding NarL/FixJ family response regulator
MPTTYHIPLKSLQPIHMKIIELYLKCWKKKDIAEEVGVSCTTVSHTLRDPVAQKIIKNIMKDRLQKSMQHFSVQA